VFRLVRPCSYALALDLGLVASEVCIPLIQRCLRAPCLYIGGACSLARPRQTELVVWPPPCTEGNKARGGLAESLIVKTTGSGPGEACRKAHRRPTCAWGRTRAIHGVTRPGAWPVRGIPCEGLQRGLGESLSASWYLGKNTRVVDGSLHIPCSLSSAFYTPYLGWLVDRFGT
jgi:hypothetical protein